jgi:hypothetical protein
MLSNIIEIKIINIIIYIEGSIATIGSLLLFFDINFKASLVIIIINFNGI